MNQHLDQLKECIKFFNERREQFLEEHHRQFVVIFNNEIVGFYNDEQEAYVKGKSIAGERAFLLRQCLTFDEEEAKKPVFRSRVV